MAVIAARLTLQYSYHSNTDRSLSVAMATGDAEMRLLGVFWDVGEQTHLNNGHMVQMIRHSMQMSWSHSLSADQSASFPQISVR